jgi:hypothetical protein
MGEIPRLRWLFGYFAELRQWSSMVYPAFVSARCVKVVSLAGRAEVFPETAQIVITL